MNDDRATFHTERQARIASYQHDTSLQDASNQFMRETLRTKYSYQFDWLGLPIIQYPQDIVAMQEIIWSVRPDLIIETGIARGGSLIFSASMLALLDATDLAAKRCNQKRCVLGIDLDIRSHNRLAIEQHPLSSYIQMIEGSSIDLSVISQVTSIAADYSRILVCLDSNHTHDHVLAELEAYTPLVTIGSYCVVFDTIIEDYPEQTCSKQRSWDIGNNPKTAIQKFLLIHSNFQMDSVIYEKLLITSVKNGYLKKIV